MPGSGGPARDRTPCHAQEGPWHCPCPLVLPWPGTAALRLRLQWGHPAGTILCVGPFALPGKDMPTKSFFFPFPSSFLHLRHAGVAMSLFWFFWKKARSFLNLTWPNRSGSSTLLMCFLDAVEIVQSELEMNLFFLLMCLFLDLCGIL